MFYLIFVLIIVYSANAGGLSLTSTLPKFENNEHSTTPSTQCCELDSPCTSGFCCNGASIICGRCQKSDPSNITQCNEPNEFIQIAEIALVSAFTISVIGLASVVWKTCTRSRSYRRQRRSVISRRHRDAISLTADQLFVIERLRDRPPLYDAENQITLEKPPAYEIIVQGENPAADRNINSQQPDPVVHLFTENGSMVPITLMGSNLTAINFTNPPPYENVHNSQVVTANDSNNQNISIASSKSWDYINAKRKIQDILKSPNQSISETHIATQQDNIPDQLTLSKTLPESSEKISETVESNEDPSQAL